MLGRDPLAEVPQDMARGILEHINERVETIHQAWDWPEWTVTEERAFRQVWNSGHQYKRASDIDGLPDEVFYLGDGFIPGGDFGDNHGYYRVIISGITDPPIGTLPSDDTYWELMDEPIDSYVAYEQVCRKSIGRVMGVYRGNPRLNGCGGSGLMFKPSQFGIDVRGCGNETVFLTYMMPLPVYTIVPRVVGKTYVFGDVVFYPTTGECYRALDTTTNVPTNTTDWAIIPFLEKWATFVVQGAFADCLWEFDQGGNDDLQAKAAIAAKAEEKANKAFEARLDELAAQGQVLKYSFCKAKCGCWCESVAFSGGAVTTLTEECEGGGPEFPPPPPVTACDTSYHSEIVAILTADGTPSLEELDTTSRRITCTLISIVIVVSGSPEVQQWRLDSGAADGGDDGQVAPADYDATSNNKHWVKVG